MDSKTSRGFSLLEIVIAMLVMSLVVAGIYGLFITSHNFIGDAGRRLQAAQYARQILETLRVYVSANANFPANAGNAFTDGLHPLSDITNIGASYYMNIHGIGLTVFNCNYNVTSNPQGATGLKEVRLNVSWSNP